LTDWVHIGFEIALVLSSLALSFYSFRLFNKVFKGGIFGPSFRIFGFAALLLAAVYAFDMVLDLTAIKSPEFELPHYVLSLFFVVALSYGIYSLYKAWKKLGMR